MRRGFSLLEMIVVLPLLAAVTAIIAGLFPVLVRNVPSLWDTVNQQAGLTHMLSRLRKDVDAADGLPLSAAGRTADERLLLLELHGGVVCYRAADGAIIREELHSDRWATPSDTWSLPKAKVSFTRWPGGDAQAVEVRTAVKYVTQGRSEEKLANSHVFYLAAMPGRKEQQ